jgi:hypothetical protein
MKKFIIPIDFLRYKDSEFVPLFQQKTGSFRHIKCWKIGLSRCLCHLLTFALGHTKKSGFCRPIICGSKAVGTILSLMHETKQST